MMSDLVTTVIPTYNRAGLIEDALNSVYKQSYRPIEIIVVDDGSTDETPTVVNRWAKDFANNVNLSLRYIRQTNEGGNAARNKGIEQASGNLIAFLDSDDAWHADKLEKQISSFEDTRVGGVYCGVQHMDFETKEILEPTGRTYPQGWILEQLLVRDVTVQTSAYIVRKSAFDVVGNFDTSLQARQDWDMWIRLAAKYKIAAVPEILVDFREHSGERTATNPRKEIEGYRMIRKKYSDLLEKSSVPCRLQARSAYFKRMSRVYFKQNISTTKALAYGIGAIANWPFDFDAYAAFAGIFIPKNTRQSLHRAWNTIFGKTPFSIRSH